MVSFLHWFIKGTIPVLRYAPQNNHFLKYLKRRVAASSKSPFNGQVEELPSVADFKYFTGGTMCCTPSQGKVQTISPLRLRREGPVSLQPRATGSHITVCMNMFSRSFFGEHSVQEHILQEE